MVKARLLVIISDKEITTQHFIRVTYGNDLAIFGTNNCDKVQEVLLKFIRYTRMKRRIQTITTKEMQFKLIW